MLKEFWYKNGMTTLRVTLGLLFLLTFSCFWYVSKKDSNDKQYITYAAELRVLIERFTRHAGEAVVEANKDAFKYLKFRTEEFNVILEILTRGKQNNEGKLLLPPSSEDIQNKELADVQRIWNTEKANADIILSNQDAILNLHATVNTLSTSMKKIQEDYLDILNALGSRKNVSNAELIDMAQQIANANDIDAKIKEVLEVNVNNTDVERQFSTLVADFGKKLQDLKQKYNNDVVYTKLADVEKEFSGVRNRVNDIIQTAQILEKVNAAWLSIYNMIPTFLEYTTNLEKAYAEASGKRLINDTTAIVLGILTLLTVLLFLFLMQKENRKLESEINQLVHELKDLGTGNLAIQASTGAGITSAIAEAVNYALNALRKVVSGIHYTSKKLSSSALDVKRVSEELTKKITQQAEKIGNVSASANTMAMSIDRVADHAKQSAQVAEHSVEIAHEGATVVSNTIAGMERIREQIRKTEKRIQRLGKSSQEISEIVSLIDGISEQTNLLSLNAAIQAAMAGDVGLGFAVVADEVQQLAAKSSQATKEVETLVKAIQTDTIRAVESMEEAMTEVHTGTNLAHDAGRALEKIETVSKSLSQLIQTISESAVEQAEVASKISKMMEIIESIAEQTATGTMTTTESIDNLSVLAQNLKNSVAEFKLPDDQQYGQR